MWFHVFSRFLVGFHGFSSSFHGFSWFLVGFQWFSRWFHGFPWFLVGFHGFSKFFFFIDPIPKQNIWHWGDPSDQQHCTLAHTITAPPLSSPAPPSPPTPSIPSPPPPP